MTTVTLAHVRRGLTTAMHTQVLVWNLNTLGPHRVSGAKRDPFIAKLRISYGLRRHSPFFCMYMYTGAASFQGRQVPPAPSLSETLCTVDIGSLDGWCANYLGRKCALKNLHLNYICVHQALCVTSNTLTINVDSLLLQSMQFFHQ